MALSCPSDVPLMAYDAALMAYDGALMAYDAALTDCLYSSYRHSRAGRLCQHERRGARRVPGHEPR